MNNKDITGVEIEEKSLFKIGDTINKMSIYLVLDIFKNTNNDIVYKLWHIASRSEILVEEKDLDKPSTPKFKVGSSVEYESSRVRNIFIILDSYSIDFGETIYLIKNKDEDKYTRYIQVKEKDLKYSYNE